MKSQNSSAGERLKSSLVSDPDELRQHPAFQAWCELQPATIFPSNIEILKGKLARNGKMLKSIVCRLAGVGPGGLNVVAKRCIQSSAEVEHIIYERILPQLPLPSLDYYGMVAEADGMFYWLFMEDAGGKLESAQLAKHRIPIAHWLGQMHASSSQIAAASGLPDKGPDHYLQRLKVAREVILSHIADNNIKDNDFVTLQAIVKHCDLLESHWDQLEAMCGGILETLVHGDFAGRNFVVRTNGLGAAVLPFDWEEAGWGTPAVDIREAEVNAYMSAVQSRWPWLDIHSIQQMALAGRMFRFIDSIYWEQSSLKYLWWSDPMYNMRVYERRVADVITAAGFE